MFSTTLDRAQYKKRQELEQKKHEMVEVYNICDFDVDVDTGYDPTTNKRTIKRFKRETKYTIPRWLAIIFVKQCYFKFIHERNVHVLKKAKDKWTGNIGEFHSATEGLCWGTNDIPRQEEYLPKICADASICLTAYPRVVNNTTVVEEVEELEGNTDPQKNGTTVNFD